MKPGIFDDLGQDFKIVKHIDGHVSVWPADRPPPPGWQSTGRPGPRQDCLTAIAASATLERDGSAADPPPAGPDPLIDMILKAAAARDGHTAVIDAAGRRLTYAGLVDLAGRYAAELGERGVGRGDLVGVVAERSVTTVAQILGVLYAGAAYVPLDPEAPPGRRALIAERAALSLTLAGAAPAVDRPAGSPSGSADSPAYVLFTSGSTGRPKGVVVERRSVVAFVRDAVRRFGIGRDDRFLQFASYGFDTSVFETFATLSAGATLVVAGEEQRADPHALVAYLRQQGVTLADLPPGVLELISPADVPGLRRVFSGGEPCSGALATAWADAGVTLTVFYGPTEGTVAATACENDSPRDTPVPLGGPIAGAGVRLLDAELEPVRPGDVGEIHLSGPGLARGYLDDPVATALAFVPDPAGDGRLYRTGDLARVDADGALVFMGRRDRQIKIGGVRVEPGEVEAALCRHVGARQAVVDHVQQDGRGRLVAFIVPGAVTSADQARAVLAEHLPSAFVPEEIVLVDALPRTVNDKIDRAALTASLTVEEGPAHGEGDFSPLERRVAAEIFRPHLGRTPTDPDSNFFTLGGNSLQAIKLLAAVSSSYGVRLAVRDFLTDPTVRGIVRAISTGEGRR